MLNDYLTQTVIHTPVTGLTDRGEPIEGVSRSLPCRKQMKTQKILKADGSVVKCDFMYYLSDRVSQGDLLDGRIITELTEWLYLDGGTMGFKAVV